MRAPLLLAFALLLALSSAERLDAQHSSLHVLADSYADAKPGELFEQLQALVEAAAHHDVPDAELAKFDDLLDQDAYYVHQGKAPCHGRRQVIGCLLHEQRLLRGTSGSQRQSEVLTYRGVHVVRQTTEIRRGGDKPARRLDVYFVWASAPRVDEDTGQAIGARIRLIEHLPPVENPTMVHALMDAKKK